MCSVDFSRLCRCHARRYGSACVDRMKSETCLHSRVKDSTGHIAVPRAHITPRHTHSRVMCTPTTQADRERQVKNRAAGTSAPTCRRRGACAKTSMHELTGQNLTGDRECATAFPQFSIPSNLVNVRRRFSVNGATFGPTAKYSVSSTQEPGRN